MSGIKNFFQKLKLNKKFKEAGEGHSLSEPSRKSQDHAAPSSSTSKAESTRKPQHNESTNRAAAAAMARIEAQSKTACAKPKSASTSWKTRSESVPGASEMQAIKKDVKMKVKQDLEVSQSAKKIPDEVPIENSPVASNINFACPICPVTLPETEIKDHLEKCLYHELETEPGMIAATMIHTLNPKDKAKLCIETLNRYLENIIKSPSEEKYRKIRKNNKVFQERVASMKGARELLVMAVGFVEVNLPSPDDSSNTEEYYLLSEGIAMEAEKLEVIKSYLNEAEPLKPTLDRNVKVYEPLPGAGRLEFPSEFYRLSGQEVKREQQNRSETVEKSKMLRTQAMREAESQNQKKVYRFTLIRVRFPDGHILEGTFYSSERFSDVLACVRESLTNDWLPFALSDASGKKIQMPDETLQSLQLAPAAILNFSWDQSIASDAQRENLNVDQYLLEELLARKIQFS